MSEESTTPDQVEGVRAIWEAADRAARTRDDRDYDAILSFYADDAVWIMPEANLLFEGVAAIREFWKDFLSSYEGFQNRTTSVVDVGHGVVLATVSQGGYLGGGSTELQEDFAFIYEWTDGLVVRITVIRAEGGRAAAERLARERG